MVHDNGSEDHQIQIIAVDSPPIEVGNWNECGLVCNLDRYGKTRIGELA